MPSIVTLTFSPCIDKSSTVKELIPEKKLKCTNPKLEPGGGGINVARALKKIGAGSLAIFPAGGYMGKCLSQLIQKENIDSVIIETENETRENIIIVEEATNKQFRFGMPANNLNECEWKECVEVLKNMNDVEFIVASGSLPPGIPTDIFAQIARIAKSKQAKFILDSSGEALQQSLSEEIYMIKPNIGELSTLLARERIEEEELEQVGREFVNRFPCEILVISLGSGGAALITKNQFHRMMPPQVKRKSTVGTGESMVAGMVFSLSQNKNLEEVLQYGIACGTAATMNPGTELCRKADADSLFLQMSSSHPESIHIGCKNCTGNCGQHHISSVTL